MDEKKYTINFPESNSSFLVEEGVNLLKFMQAHNLPVDAPCNGSKLCRKCKVFVDGKLVYACEYTVHKSITLQSFGNTKLQTADQSNISVCRVDPDLTSQQILLRENNLSTPYLEQMESTSSTLQALKKIGNLSECKKYGNYTGVFFKKRLIDIQDRGVKKLYGVAIDIGTTGVSAALLDLEEGTIVSRASCLNPQYIYGGDVITRASYVMTNEDGLEKLNLSVINGINQLIDQMIIEAKINKEWIYRVSIAGNSIMLHLFAEISPVTIARYPYRPVFRDALFYHNEKIHANSEALITLLPSVSGYIGSDISAGLVVTKFLSLPGNTLFMDIGTNGEIVLNKEGEFFGTTTAAGPALEGMNIDCGMRAEEGAIEKVFIQDGSLAYKTIGNKPAAGICGSGLLDFLSRLLELGLVNEKGRFVEEENKKNNRYMITDNIYLSQKDIRQIQLAKGAIYTGIEFLLKEADLSYTDLDRIIIAGSFGYHLSSSSLQRIGMIDPAYQGTIDFAGNTSLYGAILYLLNQKKLKEMQFFSSKIKIVELAESEEFQNTFVNNLSFKSMN